MSSNPALEPQRPSAGSADALDTLIVPRTRDLGGFEVRRVLPSSSRQLVGPFIFFDQMGPASFSVDQGIDVRPHPHIGIATVTYLFEGEFQHRDSLGTDQMIYPGEVNWMIAGRGITHSERTSEDTRTSAHRLFGIQTWVALPEASEDVDPAFEHHGRDALPALEGEGKSVRLILGRAYGQAAPVKTFSDMFYADAVLEAGAAIPLPDDHEDRGVYVVEGAVSLDGRSFDAGRMMVFRPGDAVTLRAGERGARLMLLGGETLGSPRYLWWNFVSSSREKIEAAKKAWAEADWVGGRFTLPPGDEQEFTPLPENWQSSAAREV